MAKVTGLKNRNGHWTLRVRVPDSVRSVIGKLEISKSFGTVSFADARRLARIERVAIDQLFDDATASLMRARNSAPSDEDIRFLARSIFHRLEAGSSTVPLDPSDRDRAEEQNSEDHRMISGDVDDAGLQLVAMAAAEQAKFHVPPGTDEYSKTVHAVQRAYAEHYSRQGDRLALQSAKPQDEMFLDVSAQVPPVSRLTMSKAVELYKAAPERSKISEKTRASDRFRFAALIDIIGKDRLIADITRQDCRSAQEVLLALPANAPKKFPGIVLRDVAKMATLQQLQPMSSKSATLYVECMSAMFKWLVQEELAPRNPALGLKGPPTDKPTRRPFSIAELNHLFAASAFCAQTKPSWMYWLPRIGLWTGMRLGEITGLLAGDLFELDGQSFINIEANELRKLKTASSRRIVPIHAALRQIGLVEHARSLPPGSPLFPDLPKARKGISNAAQKAIGRHIRAVNPDPNVVFHSFRHTFRDAALAAGVPRDITALIGGWHLAGRSAMDDYGSGHREGVLTENIERIEYPGLKF